MCGTLGSLPRKAPAVRVLSPRDQHLPPTHSCVTPALSSMGELPLTPGAGCPQGSVLQRWPGRLNWHEVFGVRGMGTWKGPWAGVATPSPESWGTWGVLSITGVC